MTRAFLVCTRWVTCVQLGQADRLRGRGGLFRHLGMFIAISSSIAIPSQIDRNPFAALHQANALEDS